MNSKKVIVGLSGGVDSSITAYLLKKEGYEVIGVTVIIYGEEDKDAKIVAEHLGIEHVTIDKRDVFKARVIDYFADEYKLAHTPNPCVRCNRHVKFQALLDYADERDAAYIATGHYARIEKNDNGRFTVYKAEAQGKDQTYALCMLSQEQLSRLITPLKGLQKEDVRRIAAEINLPVFAKPDSQDICFIPDGDYAYFLENTCGISLPAGNFVDEAGKILGRHKGVHHYTIGQRRGLEFAAGKRVYVTDINAESATVTLGSNEALFKSECYFKDVNFMGDTAFTDKLYTAKVRYGNTEIEGEVSSVADNLYKFEFKKPVRAITPGQAIVIYYDDAVIAGGTITELS